MSVHPLCSPVEPYGNLSLEETESLLSSLFSDVDAAVQNGSLTAECGRAFSRLYCHQAYQSCNGEVSNSSEHETRVLCRDFCSEAMDECEQDWLTLNDLADSLVVPHLPPLGMNCSDEEFLEENCADMFTTG